MGFRAWLWLNFDWGSQALALSGNKAHTHTHTPHTHTHTHTLRPTSRMDTDKHKTLPRSLVRDCPLEALAAHAVEKSGATVPEALSMQRLPWNSSFDFNSTREEVLMMAAS